MTLMMMVAALPIMGFLLTFALSRLLNAVHPSRWSLRLAALASCTIPLGIATAMLNLTYDSGMLGAIGAIAGILLSAGAWLGHFLVWRNERNASSTQGPGFSPAE